MKTRRLQALVLSVLLLLSLAGCAAKSMDSMEMQSNGMAPDYGYRDEAVMEAETMAPMLDSTTSAAKGETPAQTARKWIVTINLRAETEDLDALLESIHARIDELGGYVENSSVYNGSRYSGGYRYRNASMTVRVPAEKAEQFTDRVGEVSNVISNNKTMDDITLTYVAVESRMKALEVEQERLLELLAQAENMSDLLEIESRLTDVRYELERAASQMRVYDNQVDYATIYLDISEVVEFTVVEEQTVWQRIGSGFMSSLKDVGNFFVEIFVFLLANLPVLVLVAAGVLVIVLLCRRSAKKRRERRQNNPPHYYPPMPPQENGQ